MILQVNVMSTDIPLIPIPDWFVQKWGDADEGTRMYRVFNTDEVYEEWFEDIHKLARRTVSPGGVGMFARVSRAGVHKRIKEGRLTAFMFHKLTKKPAGIFRKERLILQSPRPYVYIPVIEAKGWAAILKGKLSIEELHAEIHGDGDWDGDFMNKTYKEGRVTKKGPKL